MAKASIMLLKSKFIILLFLTSAQLTLGAVNQAYFHFSHFGVEDGLSQSSVYHIFQDFDGFLWFGTLNGLNKFNGYEFTIFRNEVNNPNSLSDSFIQAINEDANRNIWVGTVNGLNRIDYTTGKITRFYPRVIAPTAPTNSIQFLLRHHNGRLFALCGNIVLICQPDNTVELYKVLTDITSPIHAIAQDSHHNILISTLSALFVYSQEWELIEVFTSEIDNFPRSSAAYLLPDERGWWMATAAHGLYYFDRKTASFTQFNTDNTQLRSDNIRALQFLDDDHLLIGTFAGLHLMNLTDNTIAPINPHLGSLGGLRHSSIHSILVDRFQTVWVGTYAAGISFYSPYKQVISLLSIGDFSGIIGRGEEDRDGNLWFATEGAGLLFYNPTTGEQRLYPLRPLSDRMQEMNLFKSILIDGDVIYCGTHLGAVYRFHIPRRRFEAIYHFDGFGIHSLMLDNQRRLWIPTSGFERLVVYEHGEFERLFGYVNGRRTPFTGIRAMLELDENIFLLGSSAGRIYLLNKETLTVENIHERIPLGAQELMGVISSIVQSSTHIYIATTKMGLFRFDRNLQLVKQFCSQNGIVDSFISSLVIDHNGDLWASTGNDIFRLNRESDRFYSITPAIGSFFQEFTINAAFVSSDGTLYFPGNRGVVSFNPENLVSNPIIPPVFITSLLSNNRDITYRIRQQRGRSGGYSIVLNANENNLTINYTALNFIHPAGNRYLIKLENVDNAWRNMGNRREAYYSNLRPGRYVFRLQASNNDGLWNPEEVVLSIRVRAPFYRTNLAFMLYFILVLGAILLFARHRHKRHKLELEIQAKQIEQDNLKKLHDERIRMYANFSHELKTPLTLIMNPLQELTEQPAFSQETKKLLQKMKKNTGKMLSLIGRLMDIQKYEAGKRTLNKTTFDIVSFIEEIYDSFQHTAQNTKITFSFVNELPSPIYLVHFDKTEVEKVFLNLLSNAFKFTAKGGTVTMTVQSVTKRSGRFLSIEIHDTGQGFSTEEGEKIFEPFYQVGSDLHQQVPGTGIGLSLVRSIVTQHNGSIRANSREGVGSTFTVLLPDTETQPNTTQPSGKQQGVLNLMEEQEKKNKRIILLVDDEPDMLDYLQEKLESDYFIMRAKNGKEARSQMKQQSPDLVISDIAMPEMDGVALCEYLKKNYKYSHIPIILLSGKSSEEQKEEGFSVGADAYVVKPFSIDFLKVRIKNLVENREKIKTIYSDQHLWETLITDKAYYRDTFVANYIQFVRDNVANPMLSVTDIYEGLGMSRPAFYRKTKEMIKMAPEEFIKRVRLDTGAKLLIGSKHNISEITRMIGFSNRTFFARVFKQEYGMTPSEYQMRYKMG